MAKFRKRSRVLDGKYEFDRPIDELETRLQELEEFALTTSLDFSEHIDSLRQECDGLKRRLYSNLTPWQKVLVARHPNRPLAVDYVEMIFDDFLELHGDRAFGDDKAVLTGLARISDGEGSFKIMLVAHNKGRTMKEKMECNFGCAHPEGYRKAILRMRLAEKFGLPILTFVDTPGAYPGVGAEERGQAFAIARNIMEMSELRVPIVAVVIGEGGSGGALGISVADRLCILEYGYYSVISPEGCAAILWKGEENKQEEAAKILKLTALDLKELGIVDEIVPEPLGGAHRDHEEMASTLKKTIMRHLKDLSGTDVEKLFEERYAKLKKIGAYFENGALQASSHR
jgi:acetyl-CoA carboxylase carboxyl transferase subunit alpha